MSHLNPWVIQVSQQKKQKNTLNMWRNTGGCRVGNVCLLLSGSQISIISNCILNTVLIPTEKCTSNPSSRKLLFEAVSYRKRNWSKCRDLTVGYPAPTDTSATQALHLRLRDTTKVTAEILQEPEDQYVYVEIVSSTYVRKATPRKSWQHVCLNETWKMTSLNDTPMCLEQISQSPTPRWRTTADY